MSGPSRRKIMTSLAAIGGAAVLPGQALAQIATPRQGEGPYYPLERMRFQDQDNDLVRVAGKVEEAGGEIFLLFGRVFDAQGKIAVGARVEIWQTDVNGRDLHTAERANRPQDPNFQGFGFAITDDQGLYVFRTIKPVAYPGRTPHIHVKAFHQGRELTSQFYIGGDPLNETDSMYRRMNAAERQALTMEFVQGENRLQSMVDLRF